MRLFKRHHGDAPATTAIAPSAPAVDELAGLGAGTIIPVQPSSTPPPAAPAAADEAPATTPAPEVMPVATATRFEQLFDDWMAFPLAGWTNESVTIDRTDDGALVVCARFDGLDPAKDVELTVSDGMLWIDAAHRDEQRTEDHGVVRHEVRYEAFTRSIPLPDGVAARDVAARAHDGVLEIRIPAPRGGAQERVPVLVDGVPSAAS